uniref:C-type lectin domain-containing protein n=1 Tax=Amphilophus citrinellus TaxID=61819 RepID=A0A3Q0SL71_AMPCI
MLLCFLQWYVVQLCHGFADKLFEHNSIICFTKVTLHTHTSECPLTTHLIKRSVRCGGWFEFNRRCFYYIAKPMSWGNAERNCMSLGGHLASVHNFMEYHELQRLILHHSHEYKETWIGGSDAHQEGHWIWSDGTMFHYSNWCPGEPNNGGGHQHCLQMNFSGTMVTTVDDCSKLFSCICMRNWSHSASEL